jgi:hypothetical protein
VIAFSIGGITAPTQGRGKALWGLAAISLVCLFGWIVAPTASPFITPLRNILASLVKSNAVATVVIVGIVAMMVGRRRSEPRTSTDSEPRTSMPPFAVESETKWKPNLPLPKGVGYVGASSTWVYPFGGGNTVKNTTEEVIKALGDNKITAWGREHPGDGDLFEIAQRFWYEAEIVLETGYAFSNTMQIGAYDVQVCLEEMQKVWPPKQQA